MGPRVLLFALASAAGDTSERALLGLVILCTAIGVMLFVAIGGRSR